MRLRSRTVLNENPTTPLRHHRVHTPDENDRDVLQDCSNQDPDNVPTAAKRPRINRARRTTLLSNGCKESNFKTPVRHLRERHSSLNSAARSLYSPAVHFLTPPKDSEHFTRSALTSPEHRVFGYSAVSPLSENEENDEVFSPFTFIKNIPNRSQQSRPVRDSAVRDIPPKTRSTPAATLVLDLDETLVFSSLNVIPEAEYTFNTCFQDHKYKVYLILRPYVKDFLQAMTKHFEMFVYTSAKKEYAEKIVDLLDPNKKLFRHRLYQDDCACVLGHYVKDLNVLERDQSKTVILDNAPHTFPYHLMNMIPIKSWNGDHDDRELQKLIPYMEKLVQAEDFRNVLKKRTDHFHRLLTED